MESYLLCLMRLLRQLLPRSRFEPALRLLLHLLLHLLMATLGRLPLLQLLRLRLRGLGVGVRVRVRV